MTKQYSFKIGFKKGLIAALTAAASLAAFAGFSDVTLWDLVVEYIKPVLGSVTVGGLFAMLLNYIKIRKQEEY